MVSVTSCASSSMQVQRISKAFSTVLSKSAQSKSTTNIERSSPQQQHAGLHKKLSCMCAAFGDQSPKSCHRAPVFHGSSVWHGLHFQPRPALRRALQARYYLQAAQSWQLRVCTRSKRAPSPERIAARVWRSVEGRCRSLLRPVDDEVPDPTRPVVLRAHS